MHCVRHISVTLICQEFYILKKLLKFDTLLFHNSYFQNKKGVNFIL